MCVGVCVGVRHLVEDPDLPVDGGPWDPVAVVVEQDALFLGVAPQRRAQLLHLVHRGVQALFVAGLEGQGERAGEVEGSSDLLPPVAICTMVSV